MEPRPARRFTLADGMALVAASGLGFALIRFVGDLPVIGHDPWWRAAFWTWSVALPITTSLVILRLLDRGATRHRFRAPGAAACLAASIAPWLDRAFSADRVASAFRLNLSDLWQVQGWSLVFPRPMAVAVAGAWAALALGRRWRPEPTWIDRAGIALGAFWIASMFAVPVLNLLPR